MVKHLHRIFLKGGITPELSEDALRTFFQRFGEVVDVYIPKDPTNNQLKGFAFIAYSDALGVDAALQENGYTVEGHFIPVTRADPRDDSRPRSGYTPTRGGSGSGGYRSGAGYGAAAQLASTPPAAGTPPPGIPPFGGVDPMALAYYGHPGGGALPPFGGGPPPYPPPMDDPLGYYNSPAGRGRGGGMSPSLAVRGRGAEGEEDSRIYVGGVPNEITQEDIKEHFEQYGTVLDVYFPKDKATGKRRTFCYVKFGRFEEADTACARSQRNIKGQDIFEIRIAQPRPGDRFKFAPY